MSPLQRSTTRSGGRSRHLRLLEERGPWLSLWPKKVEALKATVLFLCRFAFQDCKNLTGKPNSLNHRHAWISLLTINWFLQLLKRSETVLQFSSTKACTIRNLALDNYEHLRFAVLWNDEVRTYKLFFKIANEAFCMQQSSWITMES